MIQRLFLICLTLAGLSLWFYAQSYREPRADFVYANPSDIHSLDPARMSWTQDFRVALNIWEGLTTWDAKTLESVGAAAFYPPEISSDRLRYTFTIRPDARWSNGNPVTSDDFIRGWRRAMEPGTATDYAFLLTDHIAGADDYVRWRYRAISILSTLWRLSRGLSIQESRAVELINHPVWERIKSSLSPSPATDSEEAPNLDLNLSDRDSRRSDWVKNVQDSNKADLGRKIDRPTSARAKARGFLLLENISQRSVDWASWHRAVLTEHAAELDERFSEVGVRAIDERTLVVDLNQPCPFLPDITGMPVFLPCHESIELLRERFEETSINAQGLVVYDPQWTKPDYHANGYPGLITNGAYRLANWAFKRRARLAVNLYYRNAADVPCRTIDMMVFGSVNAALMAYEAGTVDFLPDMNVSYAHELVRSARSGERPDFHQCHVSATYFLNFNCAGETVGGKPNPLTDRRVRQALSLAVDRRSIVEKVRQRGERVAYSFVPPDSLTFYQPPEGLSFDPERAKALLVEAGYADPLELPPLEILLTHADQRVGQAIAHMWERYLDIRVTLRRQESKTFAEDKANQRYFVARGNWYADYNDPTTFLNCLTTGNGNNDSGYSNEDYDELIGLANREQDAGRRGTILARAERLLVEEDCPILPIFHYSETIAIKPYVHGLVPNPRLWFPLRQVRVEGR